MANSARNKRKVTPVTINVINAMTEQSPDCNVKTFTRVVNKPAAAFMQAGLSFSLVSIRNMHEGGSHMNIRLISHE
jgi:hypothetical protein